MNDAYKYWFNVGKYMYYLMYVCMYVSKISCMKVDIYKY